MEIGVVGKIIQAGNGSRNEDIQSLLDYRCLRSSFLYPFPSFICVTNPALTANNKAGVNEPSADFKASMM